MDREYYESFEWFWDKETDKKGKMMNNDYLYHCSGCEKPDKENVRVSPIQYHNWARTDAYGIYTGLYCDKCYDDPNKYTYRKDEYYDPAYAGERLEPNE